MLPTPKYPELLLNCAAGGRSVLTKKGIEKRTYCYLVLWRY